MADGLFNKPENKIIDAYDVHGNIHQRELKNFKFRASAYGVLVENGKVLFKRQQSVKKFDLPGGGIEIGETISEGLVREFKEETGLSVKVGKLLFVDESFFTHNGEDAHGILIFYEVEKIGGSLETNDDDSQEVKYIEISLLNYDIIHRACWNIIEIIKTEHALAK